jgi:hypothetical protein
MSKFWENTDPRSSQNGSFLIVIWREDGPDGRREVTIGSVETKHNWCIWTQFLDMPLILEHEPWPEEWMWIDRPGPLLAPAA